jgi:hypothetical protein
VRPQQLPGPVGYVVPSVRLRHCGLLSPHSRIHGWGANSKSFDGTP